MKGYKQTKEHIEICRQAKIGKPSGALGKHWKLLPFSKTHKNNIAKAMKGKRTHLGCKWTEEQRVKNSGKPCLRKTKIQISQTRISRGVAVGSKNPFWGRKHSLKTKRLMGRKHRANPSMYWLGKKKPPFSKTWRENMSIAHLGKKNVMYIDGRRSNGQYYPYEFRKIREKIRKRDGYKCQLCGVAQKKCRRKLDIHHIDYDVNNCQEKNLLSLCSRCNGRVNFNRIKWTQFFKSYIKKKFEPR